MVDHNQIKEADFKTLCNWMIDNLTDEAYEKWLIVYGEILRLQTQLDTAKRGLEWKMVSSLALKHEFELETDNMVRLELICEKSDIADKMQLISGCNIARPIDEWHEDYGDVLWWTFPIEEPPYCGTPLNSDWPDYHTHWTPIIIPLQP